MSTGIPITQAIATLPPASLATELTVEEMVAQVEKIQHVMMRLMKEGEHFGTPPGCKKPCLYKPGAEKLGFLFRLGPRFTGERQFFDLAGGHREYLITCELYSIVTGTLVGSGVGSCSTMETKYRYRTGPREPTGKPVPKEYWEVRKTDPAMAQILIGGEGFVTHKGETGKWEIFHQGAPVENPNIADTYNTVLKMAKKRAHIDAVLTATAASDIFTQDIIEEEHDESGAKKEDPSQPQMPQAKSANGDVKPENGQKPRVISEAQDKRFWAIARANGWKDFDVCSLLDAHKISSSPEIPAGAKYDELVKQLLEKGSPTEHSQQRAPGED